MNRVAELRAAMQPPVSTRDLASVVGCSHEQIRKIEDGFSNPGLMMARRVAAALGVTLDEAFPPKSKKRAA